MTNTIADRIRYARTYRRMTQMALAHKIDMPVDKLDSIEAGLTNPTPHLFSLAEALDVELNWLLNGAGKPLQDMLPTLPMYDWEGIKAFARAEDPACIDAIYSCPVPHSDKAYTITGSREGEFKGAVFFLDPVAQYQSGDFAMAAFPESNHVGLFGLTVANGTTLVAPYHQSPDTEAIELQSVNPAGLLGSDLSKLKSDESAPQAILVGKLIFTGVPA